MTTNHLHFFVLQNPEHSPARGQHLQNQNQKLRELQRTLAIIWSKPLGFEKGEADSPRVTHHQARAAVDSTPGGGTRQDEAWEEGTPYCSPCGGTMRQRHPERLTM